MGRLYLQRSLPSPGDITAKRGHKPVTFVAVDDDWIALRFKKV